MLYQDLTSQIIASVIAVHNGLGPGLLEAPYHNALYYELRDHGLSLTYNAPFPVNYKGKMVGEYFAGLRVGLLVNFHGLRASWERLVL